MDYEKAIAQVLRAFPPLVGTGRFVEPILSCGRTPPAGSFDGGRWSHATSGYRIALEEANGLDVMELVAFVTKKRNAALADLMKFLDKQMGKAKRVYALQGWWLRETVIWGAKSKTEPRGFEFYTNELSEPFDGATVFIDSTYAFA